MTCFAAILHKTTNASADAVLFSKQTLTRAKTGCRRYNPHDGEGLQKELGKSLDRMLMLRLDIEHMTGKEAIELTRARLK